MVKTYTTTEEALNDFCLDQGFNPFLHGMKVKDQTGKMWEAPTAEALTALGYPVKKTGSHRRWKPRD